MEASRFSRRTQLSLSEWENSDSEDDDGQAALAETDMMVIDAAEERCRKRPMPTVGL